MVEILAEKDEKAEVEFDHYQFAYHQAQDRALEYFVRDQKVENLHKKYEHVWHHATHG